MNRTALIWGIVIIVIIGLAVWYYSSTSPSTNPGTNATSTTQGNEATTSKTTGGTSSTGTAKGTNTFHSIFAQSGNNQCTYDVVTSDSQSHNVIDIADGKMHAEFRTTGVQNDSVLMTYSGGVLYVWHEGATKGTKTNIKTIADLPAAIPHDLTSGAVLGTSDNNVSWDCHAWNKDVSVFKIPSYVTFSWGA